MVVSVFEPTNVYPIPYAGASQPVRESRGEYVRRPAAAFTDEPARLTPRQSNFYENLIRMALALGSDILPVDFTAADGRKMYFDRGCIKIAEHAGFIRTLVNDDTGVVSRVQLSWRVTPQ
jgi:hypothetical protein